MHPVLGLVKHDALGAFEYLVGHLHGIAAKALAHLLAHGGLVVVVGGQAVHKYCIRACNIHQILIDLIGSQIVDALRPNLYRFAHGHPHIGVQYVRALCGLDGVLLKGEGRPGLGGNGLTLLYQRGVGLILFGCTGGKVQTHLGAAHHQAVAHVVAGIAEVNEMDALQVAEMLLNGKEIG